MTPLFSSLKGTFGFIGAFLGLTTGIVAFYQAFIPSVFPVVNIQLTCPVEEDAYNKLANTIKDLINRDGEIVYLNYFVFGTRICFEKSGEDGALWNEERTVGMHLSSGHFYEVILPNKVRLPIAVTTETDKLFLSINDDFNPENLIRSEFYRNAFSIYGIFRVSTPRTQRERTIGLTPIPNASIHQDAIECTRKRDGGSWSENFFVFCF